MSIFENIIIVSDIDGTFKSTQNTLIDKNIEAVEYFKAHGGKFTFATGRPPYAIDELTHLCNAPIITLNGACVYDFHENIRVKETFMNIAHVINAVGMCKTLFPEICIIACAQNSFLIETIFNFDKKTMVGDRETRSKDLAFWHDEKIFKLLFKAEPETLQAFEKILKATFGDNLKCVFSSPRFFEVTSPSVNKGDGIKYIKEYYNNQNLPPQQIIAVGDYLNDLELLAAADISACPENATQKIKNISTLHLCHCDHAAIADLVGKVERSRDNKVKDAETF